MKNKISLLLVLIASAIFINNSLAQAPTTPNIVEIDPDVPVRLGWDYTLPDSNVTGFRVLKKVVTPEGEEWTEVGSTTITEQSTVLDLFIDLPVPYEGTYVVVAYNPEYTSENSEAITLVNKPVWTDIPLAPNNLRVIQLPQ